MGVENMTWGKQFTEKNLRMRGEWLVCDVCRMHKEGVQIRKKHCKGQWVCNDCYANQIEFDKKYIETLGQTKTQWKRRKRSEKELEQQ
jgi:hypothetical protein